LLLAVYYTLLVIAFPTIRN